MPGRWCRRRSYRVLAAAVGLICLLPGPGQSRPGTSGGPGSSQRTGEAVLLARAQEHLRRGQPRQALGVLKQGLRSYPGSVRLHSAAAGLLGREGDYSSARIHYQRVVTLAPRSVVGYFGLAQVAFALRDYEGSAAALRRVLRIQPDSAPAHAKLGMTYVQQEKTQAALASFRKALALDPASAEAQFYLGDLLRRLSRLDEAQVHLEKAAALSPGNPHFHVALGELFLQRQQGAGTLARSLAAYQQAVQLDPRLAEAYYGLGRVHARQRRWQEAAEALRAALRLNPNLGRAHFTLAQVCRRLGRPAEATAHLEAFRRYREGHSSGGRLTGARVSPGSQKPGTGEKGVRSKRR